MISLNYIQEYRESEREIHHGNWLPGWWLNQPIWKIWLSKWVHLPQIIWRENSKNIWVGNHHPVYIHQSPPLNSQKKKKNPSSYSTNIPALQYSPTDRPHPRNPIPSHLLQRLGVIPLRPSYLPFGWWLNQPTGNGFIFPQFWRVKIFIEYLSCHHPDMQMMFKAPCQWWKKMFREIE